MKASADVKGIIIITEAAFAIFGSVLKGSGSIAGVHGGNLGSLARGIASEGTTLYVDVGQAQGVKPGDLFIVYRSVELDSSLYALPAEAKKVIGTRRAIGEIVILKVGERASSALVTYASDGISLGDSVERR
jgi:hypothetical protein